MAASIARRQSGGSSPVKDGGDSEVADDAPRRRDIEEGAREVIAKRKKFEFFFENFFLKIFLFV